MSNKNININTNTDIEIIPTKYRNPKTDKIEKLLTWQIYLKYLNMYQEKYQGEKVMLFMQVGSFYEIYSKTNKPDDNIMIVANFLNFNVSRKNTTTGKPYMAGCPMHAIKNYVIKLIKNDYTVVIIDQVDEPNVLGKYERYVSKVYSKSMLQALENDVNMVDENSNYLMCMYLEANRELRTNEFILSVGLSCIDMSTGKNTVYDLNSKEYNVYEEAYRFIETFNVTEMIIHKHESVEHLNNMDILKKFNITDKYVHFNFYDKPEHKKFFKITFQQQFLSKIFPDHGVINSIDYCGLERKPYALNSYIMLLQFGYEHYHKILEKIEVPVIFESKNHLILYNNAIYQLDVIPNKRFHNTYRNKIKSLYDVIKNTLTPMGKRELKIRLLNPITNIKTLNDRYDNIEIMIENDLMEKYRKHFSQMIDIERYHRKLLFGDLTPAMCAGMKITYDKITKVLNLTKLQFKTILKQDHLNISDNDIKLWKQYLSEYNKYFNIEKMFGIGDMKIDVNIFNQGCFDDLDEMQKEIDISEKYLTDLEIKLNDEMRAYELNNTNKPRWDTSKPSITLESRELKKRYNSQLYKEVEYFYLLNNRRAGLFPDLINLGKIDKAEGLELIHHSSANKRISSKKIRETSELLTKQKYEIGKKTKQYYQQVLKDFKDKYGDILIKVNKLLVELDITQSNAKTTKEYGYCKPEIIDQNDNKSFIRSTEMRHPIAERLLQDSLFIPNDVYLSSKDYDGMLLYSINAAGKSTYMKSVGLNILLAQMGMYVAAETFEYFPYTQIFTRISGDDNIFYGQSSFAVEMAELRSILKYCDSRSLVLGDEVCKGTETTSALALVSSSLCHFCERKTSFIFATHLHKLVDIQCVKNLNNLSFFHLSIRIDNGKLIYDRKLTPGSGESIYGLEVARHMIKDNDFIKQAFKVRNELMNVPEYILNPVNSQYDSNLYVDHCQICGSSYKEGQLDTHHIIHQAQCKDGLYKHIKKDCSGNEVVLCKKHHVEIHQGKIELNGFLDTTEGKILDYKFLDTTEVDKIKKKRKKYDEEDMIKICQYGEKMKEGNWSKDYVLNKLKEDYDITVSLTIFNKIINGTYINTSELYMYKDLIHNIDVYHDKYIKIIN